MLKAAWLMRPYSNLMVYRSSTGNPYTGQHDLISYGSEGREGGEGAAADVTNCHR
jgi:hypothetical protein